MFTRARRHRSTFLFAAAAITCAASALLAQDQPQDKDKLYFVPIRASVVMSPADQTRIGVDRLTPEQRFALDVWLTRYSAELRANAFRQPGQAGARTVAASNGDVAAPEPAEPASEPPQRGARSRTRFWRTPLSTIPPAARLESTPDDGSFVRLADGTLWEVYPPDRTFTDEWNAGDYITVTLASTAQGDFDHVLVDTNANTRAHVRFVDVVGSRRR
jgi:hypothetical protein